jgi:hypothetical protein
MKTITRITATAAAAAPDVGLKPDLQEHRRQIFVGRTSVRRGPDAGLKPDPQEHRRQIFVGRTSVRRGLDVGLKPDPQGHRGPSLCGSDPSPQQGGADHDVR